MARLYSWLYTKSCRGLCNILNSLMDYKGLYPGETMNGMPLRTNASSLLNRTRVQKCNSYYHGFEHVRAPLEDAISIALIVQVDRQRAVKISTARLDQTCAMDCSRPKGSESTQCQIAPQLIRPRFWRISVRIGSLHYEHKIHQTDIHASNSLQHRSKS